MTGAALEAARRWLTSITPGELSLKASRGDSLAEEAKEYLGMIRLAKRWVPELTVNAHELLESVRKTHPMHAQVLDLYRGWYLRQIHELADLIRRA